MMATSGHFNLRSARQTERDLEAGDGELEIAGGADEPGPPGCEGKRIGEDTLEVVPPGCDKQVAMKSVESIQIIITEAKIVMGSETPNQMSGKSGGELGR